MEYVLYCLFITIFIILGLNTFYRRKYNKKIKYAIQKETEKYIEKNKQRLENLTKREIEHMLKTRDDIELDLKKKIDYLHNVQDTYAALNTQIEEQQERVKNYEADQKILANERISAYESDKRAIIDTRITLEYEEKKKIAETAHAEAMIKFGEEAANAQATLAALSQSIEQFAQKQKAINEAIARQRLLEEQQDFYRVCLTEDSLSDVSFLQQVRKNLKKPEIIDKIIYDNYIAKPVLEMIKRVLQNTTCSGIYKITCTKTNEVYIGKSTDIKNRWQQHCKSAFNCGTIASSLLHTKMKQHGIENFTFELVEAVPKEQLSERESFYIDFYQSKKVGLNERRG